MFCMLIMRKYIFLTFQNITQSMKKKINLLMTPNGEGWHYLVVKKLFALIKRITSKYDSDFYCLNYLHPLRTKTNLNLIRKYLKIKIML